MIGRNVLLLGWVLCLGSAAAVAAEGSYTLVRGTLWQGVNVGGQAPRSLDSICRYSRCFLLYGAPTLSRDVRERYGLSGVSFEELASAEGVSQAGSWLYLPEDIGEELYAAGVRASLLNQESER